MRKRILVISSANMDFVQRMDRVPYAGETVTEIGKSYSYVPGGKGANSAIAFARVGADCVFACKLGRDANASKLMSVYKSEGINTDYIRYDDNIPTGLASILVEENGNNRIIVYPGANMTLGEEDVDDSMTCCPDALYMQFEMPEQTIISACETANKREIPVFIDAGPAKEDFPLESLGEVEIFSPNENETKALTGISPTSDERCLTACIRLARRVKAKYIVLKLGERGSFIYDGKEYYVEPAEKVNAVDTTAAGDVFTAVMTYVYLQNHNILSAVKYATCASAISVTRPGASTSIPTRAELQEYVRAKVKRDKENMANASNNVVHKVNPENKAEE